MYHWSSTPPPPHSHFMECVGDYIQTETNTNTDTHQRGQKKKVQRNLASPQSSFSSRPMLTETPAAAHKEERVIEDFWLCYAVCYQIKSTRRLQLILFPSLLWQTVPKQMIASVRGVRAYSKFCQEHSFTCHWLLIYSLDGPILFLPYQFLLTVALLTTSFNESLYNYDCWWPMTQTWRGCHYMNIKVIHRDVGVEDRSVAAPSPHLLRSLNLKQDLLLSL